MSGRRRAEAALVGVAGAWGLTFPLIREALADVAPLHFLPLRFTTAVLAFLPVLLFFRVSPRSLTREAPAGLLLGGVAFLSYVTQTIGLRTVPAGRAAFITGLAVVIVPLIGPLFRTGRPGPRAFLSAGIATAGLYLLSEPERGGLTSGDVWVLGCALSYAVYTQLLQRMTTHADGSDSGRDAASLAFFQVVGLAACSLITLPLAPAGWPAITPAVVKAVLFCAVAATVLTFFLQARYQRHTTAPRASLIFASEPVFAALFAYWLLGETVGPTGLAGAGLVLLAIALPQSPSGPAGDSRDALPPTPEVPRPGSVARDS
ncbi:MAG: DMT family transporter [Deltaproteobacteria bacterium]|nr:DMT family transporter [Deltaproteobacteria bacterium]